MYVALLRLIIVILGIYLFFKYFFCIVLEMLADDPNNTDEINEELNKTRKIEQFKLTISQRGLFPLKILGFL